MKVTRDEMSYFHSKHLLRQKLKNEFNILDVDEYDSPEWHHEFPHDPESILPDISSHDSKIYFSFTCVCYSFNVM